MTTDRILAPAKTHSLLADYATLFKLRVSVMVIITGGVGFYLGSLRSGISPFHLGFIKAVAGIAVVTFGSSALNQALERKTDALMRRTTSRPMAAGRISLAHGLFMGFATIFLGSLYLALATNLLTGTLTLLTAIGYVGHLHAAQALYHHQHFYRSVSRSAASADRLDRRARR